MSLEYELCRFFVELVGALSGSAPALCYDVCLFAYQAWPVI